MFAHGKLMCSIMQERLIALSRRARRALERELQASSQQRSNAAALNRSSSTQPSGRGLSGGLDAGLQPQEGQRRREAPSARQRELSDRAIRILEELSNLNRQVGHTVSIWLLKAFSDACPKQVWLSSHKPCPSSIKKSLLCRAL